MTVLTYALIKDGMVTNVILWDSANTYDAPEGFDLIESPANVGIGWSHTNGEWVEPTNIEPEIPEIVEDQSVIDAKMEALRQLVDIGITDPVARTIVGLPPA